MSVDIRPLPNWARKTRFKPLHPPVFENDDPTQADLSLALALFEALDAESQLWYGEAFVERLRARLSLIAGR